MLKKIKNKIDHRYPLMRDPLKNPKCYEMTADERLAALEKADKLLKQQTETDTFEYYGA